MDEHISITGTGSASAIPDAMRVSVTVEVTAPSVTEALRAVGDGARRAGEAARRHTDESRIRSDGFRVQSGHDNRGLERGYSATHGLLLLCDLPAAGRLVTDLGESVGDALRVRLVHPVVTDTGTVRRQARQLAFEDARVTAQQLADLAGRRLGPALQVREGGGDRGWATQAATPLSFGVDFEQGQVEELAAVTVVWALVD